MKNFSKLSTIIIWVCFLAGTAQQVPDNWTNCTRTSSDILKVGCFGFDCEWMYQDFEHLEQLHIECDFWSITNFYSGRSHDLNFYFNGMTLSQSIDLSVFESISGALKVTLGRLKWI